ncbi:glycosyltransferase family 2 protein [Dysgonomonas sp. Marseille-P4361]|uniref:glycosyltransferase family 2 protein n=1 Tax=Dysgonomonas sp. Marseille-P4361 TaxID=2161820 RepID=UPI000D55FB4A|nr:glycosyltransferase family 2 protein [Dysgonomonas sp. Marseille-P4361]
MVTFSIIIPHKNSTKLLDRLLSSIPDVDDIEVIVIDNNSTKEEKEKLRSIETRGNVILLEDDSGLGAGKARNVGLERAKGEWIIFADADDYFSSDMYSLINKYKDTKYDIIYFDTYSIYNESGNEAYRHQRYSNLVHDFINKGEEDALRYYYTPPWGKMIRRKIVSDNKLVFDEVITSNDIYFSLTSAFRAGSIAACSNVLYIITVTAGSLTNTFSLKHFDARLETALKANCFLRKIGKKKYQQSVLYFIAKCPKFGLGYSLSVFKRLIQHRSNIFVGFSKFFKYKSVLKERENRKYLVKS